MGEPKRKKTYLQEPIEVWRGKQIEAIAAEPEAYADFVGAIQEGLFKLYRSESAPSVASWLAELKGALARSFPEPAAKDDLAFLAYTGKVEHPVRDEVILRLKEAASDFSCNAWYAREYAAVDAVKGAEDFGYAALQAKQIYVADLFDSKGVARATPGKDLRELNLDVRLKAPCNLKTDALAVQVGLLLVADFGGRAGMRAPSLAYRDLVEAQWSGFGAATICSTWEDELDKRLRTLGLQVAVTDGQPVKGAWKGRPQGSSSQPIHIHWFLVVPERKKLSLP